MRCGALSRWELVGLVCYRAWLTVVCAPVAAFIENVTCCNAQNITASYKKVDQATLRGHQLRGLGLGGGTWHR